MIAAKACISFPNLLNAQKPPTRWLSSLSLSLPLVRVSDAPEDFFQEEEERKE
jgi:hypothetical protein